MPSAAEAVEPLLDRQDWQPERGPFAALDHGFTLRTNLDALDRHLARLYAPLAAAVRSTGCYSVVVDHRSALAPFTVHWGSERICTSSTLGRALSTLQWHINQQVIANTTSELLIHAAAAARGAAAAVFPAPMEGGKTTLVAGLVRAGWQYLTDEAVAVDPATRLIRPYPKPLSVDEGSWTVLQELRPRVGQGLETALERQWQVPPQDIREGAVGSAAPVRCIVATRYDPEAATALRPARRSATLVSLAQATFGWAERSRAAFAALAETVRHCRCYTLVVSDLDEACRLVTDLMEDS